MYRCHPWHTRRLYDPLPNVESPTVLTRIVLGISSVPCALEPRLLWSEKRAAAPTAVPTAVTRAGDCGKTRLLSAWTGLPTADLHAAMQATEDNPWPEAALGPRLPT